jgi:hypothetical protein
MLCRKGKIFFFDKGKIDSEEWVGQMILTDKDGTGDVLSSTSLREEGVERVVTTTNGLVRGHLTIGLDTVLYLTDERGTDGWMG